MRFPNPAFLFGFAGVIFTMTAGTSLTAQTGTSCDTVQSPDDGGPRRWETVGANTRFYIAPSESAEVISFLTEGTVLTNLGCSENGGIGWGETRPFRGGARGYVKISALTPATGPDGIVPLGRDSSKDRAARNEFDASGDVACAQERGQVLGTCAARAAHGDGGDATVVVTFPNGFARRLDFVHGEFVSANATMSGVGRDVDWSFANGIHHLRVDDQRFELGNAFVFGQ